jgi:hypothetical protein
MGAALSPRARLCSAIVKLAERSFASRPLFAFETVAER